jgi:hypothetical protein
MPETLGYIRNSQHEIYMQDLGLGDTYVEALADGL